ncbi:MAG: hypothetical protein AABZ44_06955, partial [Elusimicrobiota bacterium]
MKFKLLPVALVSLCAIPIAAGWHFGESKDLKIDIEYFDYAYKTPEGDPVYFINSTMRYRVFIKNDGNRTFKNFESKAVMRWAADASCTRFWYDGSTASFTKDSLLPGEPDSGFRPMDMGKGGGAAFGDSYYITPEICPGQAYIEISGHHVNSSGKDEV